MKVSKITKKPDAKISLKNYKKLLAEIKNCVQQAGEKIAKTSVRQKVVMAWQIGKLVSENLATSREESYGKHLLQELERDLLIKKSTLYQMHNFYQTYPKLPQDNDRLNWTHYQMLSGVKEAEERKRLESLAIENSWSSDELAVARKTPFEKGGGSNATAFESGDSLPSQVSPKSPDSANLNSVPASAKSSRLGLLSPFSKRVMNLKPARGQLFSYSIVQLAGSEKLFFDCGFKIFKEVKQRPLKSLIGSAVVVTKSEEKYLIKKAALTPHRLFAYKAYLERVVDGDTIHVVLDLGFEIFHREIIRLRGINAPEAGTKAGTKSTKVLTKILKDAPFLVVKTTGKDIYGRYVADVFLTNEEVVEAQQVADSGIYLNQLLLDKGSATLF